MPKKKKAKAVESAPDKVETQSKRGGTHPKHPPCPECGKAMYKTMTVGKAVKKADPWAFCRNKNCELYGKNQLEESTEEPTETVEEPTETVEEPTETVEEPTETVEVAPKKKKSSKGDKKVLSKEEKKARRKAVVADLLSEEYSHAEISRRNGCSRKYVKNVSLKIQSEE